MLDIKKNVPRPENLPNRGGGEGKYSETLSKMEVDDFVEVPKEWFFAEGVPFREEGYDLKKHRDRVNNAVRGWVLKRNKEAAEAEGFDKETFKPMRFTVAALENKNIGIWRDS
jgi:hypothetical protein